MDDLATAFSVSTLRRLADPMVLARGLGYRDDGRVLDLEVSDTAASATVRGSVPYEVALSAAGGEPSWTCTCPTADDGSLCKHVIAVALACADGADGVPNGRAATVTDDAPRPDRTDLMHDHLRGRRDALERAGTERRVLADHLGGLDHTELVELLLDAAQDDRHLHDRLLTRAEAADGRTPDLQRWRADLDAVFATGDFVAYRDAADWAADVGATIGLLSEVHDAGHHDAVARLCEHAHRLADRAIDHVDDSAGWLSDISSQLVELHLAACTASPPDPVDLARRLVDLELTSELDGFHRAAVTYAEVLGPAGIDEYRRLVEPRWQQLADADDWHEDRFAVRNARIGVALASGDPDELIEVRRHDLRAPSDHLEVSMALETAGRTEDAIGWARDGLATYADRPWQTGRLRGHLARLLRGIGDDDEVVELYRSAFDRAPSLGAYRTLAAEAGDREEAQDARRRLQDRLEAASADPASGSAALAQALVEILAYEGDVDEAWRIAVDHGCDERMWITLARAREGSHPLDAVAVYRRQVLDLIEQKKNPAYRAAVELMARVRRLATAADQPSAFDDLLGQVRTEHRAKRNLRALLDDRGW